MQILGGLPGFPAAILAEMVHDEPDIIEVAHPGLGMPEPEALREIPHQCLGSLHQFGRGRNPLGNRLHGFRFH